MSVGVGQREEDAAGEGAQAALYPAGEEEEEEEEDPFPWPVRAQVEGVPQSDDSGDVGHLRTADITEDE